MNSATDVIANVQIVVVLALILTYLLACSK